MSRHEIVAPWGDGGTRKLRVWAATDLRGAGREMFALVCRSDLLPRIDIIPQLSRLIRQPMITPVDAGAVDWPETGGRRLVIVFDRNFGERICQSSDKTITPMREDELVRTVFKPLAVALLAFKSYSTCRAKLKILP